MSDGSGLIYFRCTAPAHQQGVDGRTADTLTVHEGRWSYCPQDVRAVGHEWVETGGVKIEMLRRGSPTISLDLDVRPHITKPAAAAAGAGSPDTKPKSPPASRKRASK